MPEWQGCTIVAQEYRPGLFVVKTDEELDRVFRHSAGSQVIAKVTIFSVEGKDAMR
jgi:hypothetical protein